MTRFLPALLLLTACLPEFPERDFVADPTADNDGDGFTELTGDCDDDEALAYPGADEVCDGIDNDCDGDADEDDALDAKLWYSDGDRDGFGTDAFTVTACEAPSEAYSDNADDCDDSIAAINPNATETCAPYDEDCDGTVNENEDNLDLAEFFRDADGDGFGTDSDVVEGCDVPTGYVLDAGDCDDSDATLSPGAAEYCDEIDNDCDGRIDDEDPNLVADALWYPDADGDGYGDPAGATVAACAQPEGFARLGTDCNDAEAAISPDAAERCDMVDNDCDGRIDESDAVDAVDWYRDSDGDGYGNPDARLPGCTPPETYVADATDCDDDRPSVNPAAEETCVTAVDDDCDGSTNDPDALLCTVRYADVDGDSFGAGEGFCSCEPEGAYTLTNNEDCDDTRSEVNPLAYENCETLFDDDCDGATNDVDALYCQAFWPDEDGDGDGDGRAESVCTCVGEGVYTAANRDDCDDTTALIWTGADEVCGDGIDNNCEGTIDGTDSVDGIAWYRDGDGDGFGADADMIRTCDLSTEGYVTQAGDCNDGRDDIHPDARESCFTAFDDNCDGSENDPGATAEEGPIGGLQHFMDADGDGYGLVEDSVWSCADAGLHRTRTTGDCDDDNDGASPGTAETCATDFDDDCDGDDNDEGALDCTTLFYDWDGDGYGIVDSQCRCISEGLYTAEFAGDCVDDDTDINPGTESCGLSGEITMDMANAVVSNKDGEVTSAGDINGDGYGDLMVANRTFDMPTETGTLTDAGVVHIWYGPPPAAMDADLITGTESADASIVGAVGERVGDFTANLKGERRFGALNGDGYGDILIPYHTDLEMSSDSMNLVTVTGPLEGVTLRGDWNTVFRENRSLNDPLAQVVTDITTDGRDDVFASDYPYTHFYESESGFSSLAWGDDFFQPSYQQPRIKSADWSGDGVTDVGVMRRGSDKRLMLHEAILGDPGGSPIVWEEMDEFAVNIELPAGLLSSWRHDFFFGEVNGDGHADLMIVVGGADIYTPETGFVNEAGVTYIIHGPLDAYPENEALQGAATVIHGNSGWYLGSSSAFADINGDGLADPVLTTTNNPSLGVQLESFMFYSPLPAGTLASADANAHFRRSGEVRSVGDVNNDGRVDLVFSDFSTGGGTGTNPAYIFYGQPTD